MIFSSNAWYVRCLGHYMDMLVYGIGYYLGGRTLFVYPSGSEFSCVYYGNPIRDVIQVSKALFIERKAI